MELGIVVPAYRPDVDRLRSYVLALSDAFPSATIRIELDAPRPGVRERLRDLPAVVNATPARRGKGAAITYGFEHLETELLGFVDADGSTPVDSLAAVLEPLQSGIVDMSVGSRRHPDAEIMSHQTYARRWLGDGFAWLARRLLDAKLYDYQCGAKGITREAWERVRTHLYEPGFAWDVELIAMVGALGLDIAEVPITWEDQPNSTVSPIATSIDMGRSLFISRHRAKLLSDDPIHSAIASYRERPSALVERPATEETDV